MSDREEFEEWVSHDMVGVPLERSSEYGYYLEPCLNRMWRTWQARQPELDALKIEAKHSLMQNDRWWTEKLYTQDENVKLKEENAALQEQVQRYFSDIDDWKKRAFEAEDKLRGKLKVIDMDENATLKQRILELEASYDGCEKANEYNKAVIKRLGEIDADIQKNAERYRHIRANFNRLQCVNPSNVPEPDKLDQAIDTELMENK